MQGLDSAKERELGGDSLRSYRRRRRGEVDRPALVRRGGQGRGTRKGEGAEPFELVIDEHLEG
jgi:hypothetical protein